MQWNLLSFLDVFKVVCVSLHPGTVDTDLSRPYHKNVPKDKLFSTEHSVSCLMNIINALSIERTGRAYSWDGTALPWWHQYGNKRCELIGCCSACELLECSVSKDGHYKWHNGNKCGTECTRQTNRSNSHRETSQLAQVLKLALFR